MSRRVGKQGRLPHSANGRHGNRNDWKCDEKKTSKKENTAEGRPCSCNKSDNKQAQTQTKYKQLLKTSDNQSDSHEIVERKFPSDDNCQCNKSAESESCSEDVIRSSQYSLLALPDDVLYLILTYLQPKELCQLGCVCRRFQYLTSKDSVWVHHAKRLTVVKPSSSCPCSYKELCRVAPNWKLGRFQEGFAVKLRHRLMPWIYKSEDRLWFSMGNSIRCFRAHPSNHCLQEDKNICSRGGLEGDATRFVVKKDMVVSGCRDGGVYCWDVWGNPVFCYKQVHRSDTQCVDFTDSLVISGSRDATCKILPMEAPADTDDLVIQTFDAGERVWSLKISPCERFFAAGLAGCLDDPPVVLWDLESGECITHLSVNHRRGAGVLDLKFESPYELLTCGYDTFIRLWDIRTQTCVMQWEEPHDSALYCIESDGHNAIVAGTARHGMVRLWDKRKTEPVQVYYSKNRNSPVYSLAMDHRHLYLALDVGLNVMDFSFTEMSSSTLACSSSSTWNSGYRHSFK